MNGEKILIPKNNDANEGYAMSIGHLADACNPYHGDLVLIAADNDGRDHMLVCQCKNPGFIGNDHILGNCEDVRICDDGKIDDINRPLAMINCVCSSDTYQISDREEVQGVPF
jgi:hypothetical protein